MNICPECNGEGIIERGTDVERQCPTCGGRGFVPDDNDIEEVLNTGKANGFLSNGVVIQAANALPAVQMHRSDCKRF